MNIRKWNIAGALFTILVGSGLHFLFEWSGRNTVVGLFSAVNESTWEHLKLLAIPMLVFAIVEYAVYGRKIANFAPVRALSILAGMAAIPILFYTYTGIIGKNYLLADIGTFVIGVLLAYFLSDRYLDTPAMSSKKCIAAGWVLLALILVAFIVFTLYPPQIALFQDPVTGLYGLPPQDAAPAGIFQSTAV